MSFSYIVNEERNPAFNLALEETLFEKAVQTRNGFLMLWSNLPVVVVGRYQNAAEEVNLPFVREKHIRVVHRMSGGGAVYHDSGNLNYTIITPAVGRLDVRAFGEPLVAFLCSLGVGAQLSGRNDVTVCGRKISGVAQYVREGVALHHGTILFDSALDIVEMALNVNAEKFQSKGFKSVRSRVTNLRPFLNAGVTIEQFRESFAAFLREYYRAEIVRIPDREELARACALAADKYSSDGWTWEQSPPFSVKNKRRFAAGAVQLALVVQDGRVADARVSGDFFSAGGVEEVERALIGQLYPFSDLRATLPDELLSNAFLGIDVEQLRTFFSE